MTVRIRHLFLLLPLLLSACLGGQQSTKIEPAKLVPLKANIEVNKAWSAKLGKGSEGLLYGLSPVGNGARVFAASGGGNVFAFDAITGKRIWMRELGKQYRLSAGPGLSGDLLVVATNKGDVIALSAQSGEVLWNSSADGAVISRPAVSADLVAVRTDNGNLVGFDTKDGLQIWKIEREVQGLTLRGNSSPVIAANAVLTGFDNGKIAAIDSATGAVIWERAIAERRGRNEFERLADVDGSMLINGEDIFAVGFQGRAILMSSLSGQAAWSQEMSSYNSMALDWNQLYASTADDEVKALDRRNGVTQWTANQFAHRQLSAPAVVGASVVVGDFEGYLHWLSALDGTMQARTRAGSDAITAPPLAIGEIVYVQTDGGELVAFQKPALITP